MVAAASGQAGGCEREVISIRLLPRALLRHVLRLLGLQMSLLIALLHGINHSGSSPIAGLLQVSFY